MSNDAITVPDDVTDAITRIADFTRALDNDPAWTPAAPDYDATMEADRETVDRWLTERDADLELSLTLAISVGMSIGEASVRLRDAAA